MARNLIQDWVQDGWLVTVDSSRRKRRYRLSAVYRQYIGNLSAIALIPSRPIQEARGSLKGMDTDVERDEADRV